MSDEAEPLSNSDTDALVERLQARVERRKREGHYPEDLTRHLNDHYRRVTGQRGGPDLHMLRVRVDQLDHVSHFSPTRISLDSGMPGGAKLHAAVAKLVARQTQGILSQMQDFADAVVAALRLVLAEAERPQSHVHADLITRIDALYEQIAELERRTTEPNAR